MSFLFVKKYFVPAPDEDGVGGAVDDVIGPPRLATFKVSVPSTNKLSCITSSTTGKASTQAPSACLIAVLLKPLGTSLVAVLLVTFTLSVDVKLREDKDLPCPDFLRRDLLVSVGVITLEGVVGLENETSVFATGVPGGKPKEDEKE